MSEDEKRALQFAVSKAAHLVATSDSFVSGAVDPPVPDSAMGRAHQADLREAYDIAGLLLHATEDHLRTIVMVVRTGPLPTFALYTLLRTAAEAAVRCRHLLEPTISEADRLGRGLNERLDNLIEQRKVRPGDPDIAQHYEKRVAVLEGRAQNHGVAVVRAQTKNGSLGKVIGFGEAVPSEFELFDKHLPDGDTVLRFLSGYVHSKPWVEAPRSRATPTDDAAVGLVDTSLNVVVFAGLLDLAVDLYDENLGYWLALAGCPPDVWREAKRSIPAPTS